MSQSIHWKPHIEATDSSKYLGVTISQGVSVKPHIDATDSSKYLGVTISQCLPWKSHIDATDRQVPGSDISQGLSWKSHIDATAGKNQPTLGFIRRNLRECSTETKKTAYTMFVCLSCQYTFSIWDPYTAVDSQSIAKVQRKATRFLHEATTTIDHQDGCVTNMTHDLGEEPPECRR